MGSWKNRALLNTGDKTEHFGVRMGGVERDKEICFETN